MTVSTDWTKYYQRKASLAGPTRAYTARAVTALLRQAGLGPESSPWVVELGGGNSCLVPQLPQDLGCRRYTVVDNNPLGVQLLVERVAGGLPGCAIEGIEADILAAMPPMEADAVISIGLIEHFSPDDRRNAIAAHLSCVRPGGVVLLMFPTPTWLYRGARAISEAMGTWHFHDETPLDPQQVLADLGDGMRLLDRRVHWPQVFTQCSLLLRRAAAH